MSKRTKKGERWEDLNKRRGRVSRALGADFHIHIARTVLLALAEPTAGMVEVDRVHIDDGSKWRAMVKVAVRELDGWSSR